MRDFNGGIQAIAVEKPQFEYGLNNNFNRTDRSMGRLGFHFIEINKKKCHASGRIFLEEKGRNTGLRLRSKHFSLLAIQYTILMSKKLYDYQKQLVLVN